MEAAHSRSQRPRSLRLVPIITISRWTHLNLWFLNFPSNLSNLIGLGLETNTTDNGHRLEQTDLLNTIEKIPELAYDRKQPPRGVSVSNWAFWQTKTIKCSAHSQKIGSAQWPLGKMRIETTQSQHKVVFTPSPSIMQNGRNLCHSQNKSF